MNNDEIPRPEESSGARRQLPAGLSRRILVVEDDETLRRLNAEALIGFGYAVDVAEDGDAAWEVLQLNRYDLMVTDNHMPKVTGVELMVKLHGARIVLLIILATGVAPDFTRYPWLQPAATLLKPYTAAELVAVVTEVLGANDGTRATAQLGPADSIRRG